MQLTMPADKATVCVDYTTVQDAMKRNACTSAAGADWAPMNIAVVFHLAQDKSDPTVNSISVTVDGVTKSVVAPVPIKTY